MDKLSSILPPIKRNWLPALLTFSAAIVGAGFYLSVAEKSYFSAVRVSVEDPRASSVSALGQGLTQPPGRAGSADPMATQAELVKSQRVLERSLQQEATAFEAKGVPLPTVGELQRGLEVKVVPATNILQIGYEGLEPELTAQILNRIAAEVINQSSENIRLEASSIRQFLESQVPQEAEKLAQAETLETQYRQENGVVDVNAQTDTLLRNLSQLQEQQRVVAGQLQEAQTRTGMLKEMTGFDSPERAYVASRIGQDKELADLKTNLINIESQIIESRAKYQDNHPQVQSLAQQRDDIRTLYSQRLGQLVPGSQSLSAGAVAQDNLSQDLISRYVLTTVETAALSNHLSLLKQNQSFLQEQLATVPTRKQQLSTLERKRDEVKANLSLLQGKLQEARIAEAQLLSNIRIVSWAYVPSVAAAPKVPAILAIATAAGGILATGVVLLLEAFNGTLRNANEIEASSEVPVLAVLPKPSGQLLLSASRTSKLERFLDSPNTVEPYRSLLKTLEIRIKDKPRVIVMSSTVENEGKSDVIARLASVSAMLSRRTLIIDANLSRPEQQEVFALPSTIGLTHVVSKQASLREAIQPSGFENLDILSNGEFISRPSTITESAAMEMAIREASKGYDFVFVDAAPVTTSADALTLSQYSDGLVFVVRPNLTVREAMFKSMAEIENNNTPVLGVVVNESQSLPRYESFKNTNHTSMGVEKELELLPD